MKRIAAVIAAGVLAMGVLSGCSSKKAADTTTAAAAATDTTTAAAGELTAGATATGTPVSVDALETSATVYAFTLSEATVKTGKVSFTLNNKGTKQHELILLKTDTPFDQLKVGTDNKVSEDASVGEISETDAGKSVTKTFDLQPGNYVFVCNIEKHYGYGMRSAFTVTP
jgi:uncharacterized cupredoxin-like copper-binding protein